jgi:creatinine amidohydrolase
MSIHFRDLTSPEIAVAAKQGSLLLLPLGQTEEHGNHLPVGTDTFIAERVCDETAYRLKDSLPTLVLPPIEYGYSNNVMTQWNGTFTLPTRLVMDLILEICKSVIRMGFRKIVIVNAHGHHQHLAVTAAREIADVTGVDVAVLMPNNLVANEFNAIRKSPPGGACHGGEYETSLMMHFGHDADLAKTNADDFLHDTSEFCSNDMLAGSGKVFWSTWARQKSRVGIYGDPTVASAETGRQTFEAIINEMVQFCTEFHSFKPDA